MIVITLSYLEDLEVELKIRRIGTLRSLYISGSLKGNFTHILIDSTIFLGFSRIYGMTEHWTMQSSLKLAKKTIEYTPLSCFKTPKYNLSCRFLDTALIVTISEPRDESKRLAHRLQKTKLHFLESSVCIS